MHKVKKNDYQLWTVPSLQNDETASSQENDQFENLYISIH